jgi:hypothetical protein
VILPVQPESSLQSVTTLLVRGRRSSSLKNLRAILSTQYLDNFLFKSIRTATGKRLRSLSILNFYSFVGIKPSNYHLCKERAKNYTVTKSYHFLEGRCKFPALRKQKFLFDTGKCFQLPKSYFSCHQNGKLLHSGERAVFHAWKCKSPALVLNSKMNGKTQATKWEESPRSRRRLAVAILKVQL